MSSELGESIMSTSFYTILAFWAVVAALILLPLVILFVRRYRRCPSNRILVVYGKSGAGQTSICVHGGARFIWPVIQDYAYLSLEPMQIEIPLRGALSMENIRVNVPSVFTVAIGTTPEQMQNAAVRLLGLTKPQIAKQAEDIIFGQLRQVIASMHIEEINRDREAFLSSITTSLDPELRKIGLVLINVNITDITDESGYIEAIGRKAATEAIQKARGDVADNEKMGEIRIAEAEQAKAIQVANAVKVQMIGTREAERDKEVKLAELTRDQAIQVADLKKEQTVGEQSASFICETQVKQSERDMRVQTAEANATAVEGENKAKATIAVSQAELQVRQAEAYKTGETKKREAEAAVLEAQYLAQTKTAQAEAQLQEAKQRAELEAPAKAQKAKTIVEAEALAEQTRIEAEGEAKAIFAKLEAEARGNFEILAKKGEGLQRIIEACGGSEKAFQLLMLEHFDKLVEASSQAISNIKFDKIIVWDGGARDGGQSATSSFLQNMAKTLPPMMQVMKEVGGIEFPETLAKIIGVEEKPTEQKTESPTK
ncbi:flotillin [Planctomycetales bacterium]|nr:flotillin [Planctomycetales bacterium]